MKGMPYKNVMYSFRKRKASLAFINMLGKPENDLYKNKAFKKKKTRSAAMLLYVPELAYKQWDRCELLYINVRVYIIYIFR